MNSTLLRAEALLKEHMDLSRCKLLVACSGGVDSVVLLHMLHRLRAGQEGMQLFSAHFHHGIRGEDADADADFVARLCAEWEIPFLMERADIPAISKAAGMTLEEAARTMRYAFLRRAKAETGAAYILTAHHMQDQAETILMHMVRGCGLSGLCGMRICAGDVLRPLLTTSREEIEAYAKSFALSYCVDATNMDTAYLRNRIRHELLPLLQQKFNPSIVQGLANMSGLLAEDERYLHEAAEKALDDASMRGEKDVYDREMLAKLPLPIKSRAIRIALQRAGMLYDMQQGGILRICDLLELRTGAFVELPEGARAWASYRYLHIGRPMRQGEAFCMPYQSGEMHVPGGKFLSCPVSEMRKDEGPFVAYFDLDKLPDGLVVRKRLPGDRFFPLGAKGGRKLKKYLIDKKIPRDERELPLIAKDGEVIFFPGGAIADFTKVTEATRHIIRIEFFPDREELQI